MWLLNDLQNDFPYEVLRESVGCLTPGRNQKTTFQELLQAEAKVQKCGKCVFMCICACVCVCFSAHVCLSACLWDISVCACVSLFVCV